MEMQKEMSAASQELIEKFAPCKSAEEVVSVAKVQNLNLTPEQAGEILQVLSGELSDETLKKVVGGYPFAIGLFPLDGND